MGLPKMAKLKIKSSCERAILVKFRAEPKNRTLPQRQRMKNG